MRRNNIEIYQKLAPGVVNITSTILEQDFFFNAVPRQGAGSGSIIDPRGYILTNHHVIEDARKLEVTLANGKKYSAKLIGSDPDTDVAVIKIEARREDLHVDPDGLFRQSQGGTEGDRHRQSLRPGADPHHRSHQHGRDGPCEPRAGPWLKT